MDWFRMYHEFASDAKVQSMSEAMQRRLLMLFCLRCSNTLVTLHDDELAFALRITTEQLGETKALFIRKNFIDDEWEIRQWNERQFVSDSSAPRVKRHREKKKSEAKKPPIDVAAPAMKRTCNVTLTPQIQNRTDTEQNRTEAENTFCTEPQSDSPPADDEPVKLIDLDDLPPADASGSLTAPLEQVAAPVPVIVMPLVGDGEFGILQSHIDEWTAAYPAVDVIRQLAAMRQWCLASPTKRKTKRGVLSFCNAWLMREQDRPARPAQSSGGSSAWWASEATIIAKGLELNLAPLNGERMPDFKARIQAAIDNGGKPPERGRSRADLSVPSSPKGVKPEGLDLKSMIGPSKVIA